MVWSDVTPRRRSASRLSTTRYLIRLLSRVTRKTPCRIKESIHLKSMYARSATTMLPFGRRSGRAASMSAVFASVTVTNAGRWPAWSSAMCAFRPPFVCRNVAHGNADRHRSSTVESSEHSGFLNRNPCPGDAFLKTIRPFVYRRYLDFGAIEAMREMKALRVHDRRYADDLKRSAGGIRNAEFTVQAQQLVRGGREAALQQTSFLRALAEMECLGVFAAQEAAQLGEAYRFLRHSEHSIQAEADCQRPPAAGHGPQPPAAGPELGPRQL